MSARTTRAARKRRIVVGFIISAVTYGLALPVTFALLAESLDNLLRLPQLFTAGTASILAAACILIGFVWITWSYSFIVFVGKGSPVEAFGVALEPTSQLVTIGPYAYVRHPMVFGFLWVLLGVGFYLRSISGVILALAGALAAWAHLVIWEERGLERRFGEDYVHYRDSVRALIPHLTPYSPPDVTQDRPPAPR